MLHLEGAKAARGLSLADLRAFVGHFIGALRGYDRVRRAEPARKAGHPERRSVRVAAFRLVEFRTGSAVATLESAARESRTRRCSTIKRIRRSRTLAPLPTS